MLQRTVHGKPFLYLDSAATALKPQAVTDAMSHFYHTSYATVHRTVYQTSLEATEKYHQVRREVATFLKAAAPEEIIFTRGATDGLNLVAHSYGEAFIQEGDEIVISGQEHHSNIVPWQLLAARKKACLRVMPLHSTGEIDLERFYDLLSPRTKLVSVSHISNVLGIVNPLPQIISAAHAVKASVVVDAAQSAPHLPLDVQQLQPDFLVFSAHKLWGPTGIGILYGRRQLLEQMPPVQGGGDMVQTVTFENTTYQPPPLRFEAGTPLIAEVIGLGAALRYLDRYGRKAIFSYEHHLIEQALQHLPSEAVLLGPREGRCSLITFYVPGVHPLDLATLLDLEGIAVRSGSLCAQPLLHHFGQTTALRLSVAPYNTVEEMKRFGETLQRLIRQLS